MRITHLVAVADPLSMIPWPAQLTLVGSLVVAIVIILRWQSWQVQKGELVPRKTHEEVLAARDDQIEAERLRASEWREAHTLSEVARQVEREITRDAVQSNKFIDYFIEQIPPLRPQTGGSQHLPVAAHPGDNGMQEAPL